MSWNMHSEKFERDAQARFYAAVDKSSPEGCWIWKGLTDKDGYGLFSYRYRNHRAHRIAYALEHGNQPVGILRHSCDTPACVRPSHLQLGTQRDNIRDSMKRGRFVFGERNGTAKLSAQDVSVIRGLLAEGQSQRSIARQFSVTHRVISLIAIGRRKTAAEWVNDQNVTEDV